MEVGNDVTVILDMLSGEVRSVVEAVSDAASEAASNRDLDGAAALIDLAQRVEGFTSEVERLRASWSDLDVDGVDEVVEAPTAGQAGGESKKAYYGRIRRGTKTGQDEFRRPVLEALVELGGSESVKAVLEVVEQKMAGRLNDIDRQSLPSSPNTLRWSNTAQWARNDLVKEGLMARTRRGTWAISDEGRRWLRTEGASS